MRKSLTGNDVKKRFWPILVNLQGSEGWCNNFKHEVEGMVRVLGCPSYFVTLGPADRDWRDLLIYLYGVECREHRPWLENSEVVVRSGMLFEER